MTKSREPKPMDMPDHQLTEINEQIAKLESLRSVLGDGVVNQKRAWAACVVRGGSWIANHRYAYTMSRLQSIPGGLDHDVGFRPVISIAKAEV